MQFKKVNHVLFDLDGLLIDSEILYAKAYEIVCAKYGKEFTWEINVSIMGGQMNEVLRKLVKTLDIPITPEQMKVECLAALKNILPDVKLMPGGMRLVKHLHKHGVPIALATSSTQNSVDVKMQKHQDLLTLFHHLVMGGSDPDVTRGKPDPSIFLVCASRFPDKPNPEDCLVFEDAVNGMKAAVAANMQVVVVPDSRVDKQLLAPATLVLTSLEQFQPELFGLPPYDD